MPRRAEKGEHRRESHIFRERARLKERFEPEIYSAVYRNRATYERDEHA